MTIGGRPGGGRGPYPNPFLFRLEGWLDPKVKLTLGAGELRVRPGGTAEVLVTLTRRLFEGPVTLQARNVPAGVTATFAPPTTTGTAATLRLGLASTAAPGTFLIEVRGEVPGGDLACSWCQRCCNCSSFLRREGPAVALVDGSSARGFPRPRDQCGSRVSTISLDRRTSPKPSHSTADVLMVPAVEAVFLDTSGPSTELAGPAATLPVRTERSRDMAARGKVTGRRRRPASTRSRYLHPIPAFHAGGAPDFSAKAGHAEHRSLWRGSTPPRDAVSLLFTACSTAPQTSPAGGARGVTFSPTVPSSRS